MRPRRLRAILQIPEAKRFSALAEGLEMLAENVAVLEDDAASLAQPRRDRGAAVLRCFADEEAAKVLIVLDMARAGWGDEAASRALFTAFYSHLARLLYVQAYGGAPADLAEVRRYVDFWRQEYFLDGPMDVDWIFGNELITGREERLYVDLVEDEDGRRRWVGPGPLSSVLDEPFAFPSSASVGIRLVEAMSRIGLLTEAGLEAVRAVWDGAFVNDEMRWSDLHSLNVAVIEHLSAGGLDLSDSASIEAARYVVEHWIFPMSSLELTLAKVAVEDLKAERTRRLTHELDVN